MVIASLGLYLVVALRLFNADKTRYIYDSSLATAATAATQVETFLARVLKDSLAIYNLVVDRDLAPAEERRPIAFERAVPPAAVRPDPAVASRIAALAPKATKAKWDAAGLTLRTELAGLYLRQADVLKAARRGGGNAAAGGDPWREPLAAAARLFAGDDGDVPQPKDATYQVTLGRVYGGLGRYEDGAALLARFLSEHGSDARAAAVTFDLAELRYRMRELDKAADLYRQVKPSAGSGIAAYAAYKLAWCDFGRGQTKAAVQRLGRLLAPGASVPASLRAAAAGDVALMLAELGDLALAAQVLHGTPGADEAISAIGRDAVRLRGEAKARQGATTELEGRRLLRNLFYLDPDMVEFSVYRRQGERLERLVHLVNKDYLAQSDLTEAYLARVDAEKPLPFGRVTDKKPILQGSSLKGGLGLLTLIRRDPLTGRYLVVRFKLDRFLGAFTANRAYTTYLVDAAGELFAHPDQQRLVLNLNMLEEPHVRAVLKQAQKTGVNELSDRAGSRLIVAHAEVGLFDLVVLSEIKTEKAFLAARELTVKSVYFGGFFIAVAMIIGIFFAKTLTTPIDKLFKGTKVIAAGNFKASVHIKANDEIGVLADSFNFMAGRIVKLLEQEKDKVRLEQEIKVAKLVQDSFFPKPHQILGRVDVAAFYTPASDCGGDWWGVIPHGRKVMLLIGDATGHGVPAALITATAASCTTTVQEIGALHPELLDSPARVLGLLNKAVFAAAQGKILMTFFVCLIDAEAGELTYSNASHNPPYLYKFQAAKEPDKKDLKPLMEAVGFRLGHKVETTYQDANMAVSPSDTLVFFTDGFLECTNPEKEEYGNRKFIKSILKNAKAGTEDLRDGIVGSARAFFATQPLADDLTLVVAKVLDQAATQEVA